MRITINRQYILFLILFYVFLFNEPLTEYISVIGYADELLAVLAIPIFCWQRLLRKKDLGGTGSAVYIAGFLAIAFLGSLVYQYQDFWTVALTDALLCVKFWLCIYSSRVLLSGFRISRFSRAIFWHVKLVIWVFVILTVLNYLRGLFPYNDYRFGIMSNRLFYGHPASFASCCSFLMLILLGIKPHIRNMSFYFVVLLGIMCTTLRTRALAAVCLFCALYFLVIVQKKKFSLSSLLPMVPVILLIGWSKIEYFFISMADASARAQLLFKSFAVANDHFPFGAGLATYGSYLSAEHYSPLYYTYGLNNIFGLGENGAFICDSFWPMVLGQTGYFGLIFYFLALVALAKRIGVIKKDNLFLYVSALSAFLFLILESTSTTAFVHPISIPIAMWLGVVFQDHSASAVLEDVTEELHT